MVKSGIQIVVLISNITEILLICSISKATTFFSCLPANSSRKYEVPRRMAATSARSRSCAGQRACESEHERVHCKRKQAAVVVDVQIP